jgi:hypothetical protein
MENEYGTPDFNITPYFDTTTGVIGDYVPESSHPVLTKLYEQIANLEKQLADMTEREDKQRSRAWELASNFANYKLKLENVLRTHAQDFEGTVIETCVNVADDMGIELTNTKDFEISVSWNITVAAPFGEEIDISEYDVDAYLNSVGGLDYEENDISTTVSEI